MSVKDKFAAALEELTAQIREDRSVLAAILCGSLAHDTVWARSDIDLVLITIDDKKISRSSVSLDTSGVNVHANLIPRTEFRRSLEGSLRNSFLHSLLAKGRLLYTHDETIEQLLEQLREPAERDLRIQLLSAGTHALGPLDKAHKWFVTRGDLNYSALWILYAATPLARLEVLRAGLLTDREVIPQALQLNPDLFNTIYVDLLNTKKTRKGVQAALDAADAYLRRLAPELFGPILDHLREAGEARSATEIEDYFKRHFNVECVALACEYLSSQGLIAKVSIGVQLTKRSNVQVQEQAFVYVGDAPDVS